MAAKSEKTWADAEVEDGELFSFLDRNQENITKISRDLVRGK